MADTRDGRRWNGRGSKKRKEKYRIIVYATNPQKHSLGGELKL